MKRLYGWILVATFSSLVHVTPVVAVSISVDLDPMTGGIQNSASFLPGDSFTADVVISELIDNSADPNDGLNAYEFDLDFNPSVINATGIASGGFLPIPSFVVEQDIVPPDVNFAEATLGPSGSFGSGVLASISFNVVGPGTAVLDLNDVILSAPFGQQISDVTINDATVGVVPEPASVLLMATGLTGLVGVRWWKGKRVKKEQ